MKDAGIFECRAKGPGGIVTARAWLKINGHLNIPPLPGKYIFFPSQLCSYERLILTSCTLPENGR